MGELLVFMNIILRKIKKNIVYYLEKVIDKAAYFEYLLSVF